MHDRLNNGRRSEMLTVLDEFTREALCVRVATKMGSEDVLDALGPLMIQRGAPTDLRSDNGAHFIAEPLYRRLRTVAVEPMRIFPGSRWANGTNARFNGTLRREAFNAEWFASTRQAQLVIDIWRRQYNRMRPYYSLNRRPPVPKTL